MLEWQHMTQIGRLVLTCSSRQTWTRKSWKIEVWCTHLGVHDWFSPLLPARTALFPSFQSCLAFIHIAPCFNIHNSICLKQTSPASFSHLLRYCSNVTYSMKNALIPQGIQCSLLVFAIVPCIDLHSLNKYWPLSQSLSKPVRRGVRLLILGIPHSSCRPCCEQRPLELCLWWPSETQSTSSLTFLLLWYPSGRRTKWPFWSK